MTANNNRQPTHEEIMAMSYKLLLDLDIRVEMMDKKIDSLQQDISRTFYVRSELFKLRFDHKTDELYITEFFKIPFEGNESILLRHMFKKSNGLAKKSVKFYPAELAGEFKKETDGLKTAKSIHGTITRIDATIKYRTMGLEVFKITTKIFYFL